MNSWFVVSHNLAVWSALVVTKNFESGLNLHLSPYLWWATILLVLVSGLNMLFNVQSSAAALALQIKELEGNF